MTSIPGVASISGCCRRSSSRRRRRRARWRRVVAAVPLLALLLGSSPPVVTTRAPSPSNPRASAIAPRKLFSGVTSSVPRRCRPGARCTPSRLDHLRIDGDRVAVHEREHDVDMQYERFFSMLDGDDPRSAAPFSNSRCANSSTMLRGGALAECRSSTAPLPIGMTSPPSSAARPKSWMSNSSCSSLWSGGRIPEIESGVAEHRMEAVDDADVDGLELPRRASTSGSARRRRRSSTSCRA